MKYFTKTWNIENCFNASTNINDGYLNIYQLLTIFSKSSIGIIIDIDGIRVL